MHTEGLNLVGFKEENMHEVKWRTGRDRGARESSWTELKPMKRNGKRRQKKEKKKKMTDSNTMCSS